MSNKIYIGVPAKYTCGNGRYAKIIIKHLVIICDEIIKMTKSILTKTVLTKSISTNFNKKGEKILYFTEVFINYHDIVNSC